MHVLVPLLLAVRLAAAPAGPDSLTAAHRLTPSAALSLPVPVLSLPVPVLDTADAEPAAPDIVEYSDAYFTRLTIHRIASYATLPLFAGMYITGTKIANQGRNAPGWARQSHGPMATAVALLFGVNTITGGMNLWEGRKDPEGRTQRTIHGVLMLAADAGFLVTGQLANSQHQQLHKRVATISIGTALVSYLMMLPPFRRD